jgi:hypothetical protein
MKIKRAGRRAPVVLARRPGTGRASAQTKSALIDLEALSEPLPGPMLVLLSRLHRTERPRTDEDERS